MRKCTRCEIEKDISEFGIKQRKTRKGKIKSYTSIYCKVCEAAIAKEWRQNNSAKLKDYNAKPKVKERKKKWEEENLPYEDRKSYFQQYYQDNKNEIKKTWNTPAFKDGKRKYKRKRRHMDPVFRMRENVSNAILKALKNVKSNKAGRSILQYLSYAIQDLKEHIEKQFSGEMSWDNYGIFWHIDHIVPQSDLPYSSMDDDNFKRCWALNNLRPLEAKRNMLEGAKRTRHK